MTAQPQGFDPVQFKETTREQWERGAEAWHRWRPTLQAWLGPVTEAMLELTHICGNSRGRTVSSSSPRDPR